MVGVSGGTGRFWSGYWIVVPEFAHAIHYAINDFQIPGNPVHSEINKLNPTFQGRLEMAYAEAQANVIDDWEASAFKSVLDRRLRHEERQGVLGSGCCVLV